MLLNKVGSASIWFFKTNSNKNNMSKVFIHNDKKNSINSHYYTKSIQLDTNIKDGFK